MGTCDDGQSSQANRSWVGTNLSFSYSNSTEPVSKLIVMSIKKNKWLEQLNYLGKDSTKEEIKKILNYVKWVKMNKVSDDFEQIFSKFK